MYYIYFAESLRNGKIYVGFTEKLPNLRVKEHNESSNKWSRNNKPLKLSYYETYSCKEDAVHREDFFKTGIGKKIKKAIVETMRA